MDKQIIPLRHHNPNLTHIKHVEHNINVKKKKKILIIPSNLPLQ